jgi:alpha,alpha-trehalose phosphorylase
LMDLGDVGGNVRDGAHIASMGGTWMALVYGFAGMRDYDGRLSFHPRLPARWYRLRFPLTVRGQRLEVDIRPESTFYRLVEGRGMAFEHAGHKIELNREQTSVECPNPPPGSAGEPPGSPEE